MIKVDLCAMPGLSWSDSMTSCQLTANMPISPVVQVKYEVGMNKLSGISTDFGADVGKCWIGPRRCRTNSYRFSSFAIGCSTCASKELAMTDSMHGKL